MRHYRYIFLFTLLCAASSAFAHKHKADTTNYTYMRLYDIYIEPLALLDMYNSPSLRLGTEYSFSRRYAIAPTFGVYHNGIMLKVEAKKYFRFTHKRRNYISLEYFYKDTKYGIKDSIQAIIPYVRNYTVDKYVNALTLKTGIVTFSRHHFISDAYFGVGIRYHDVVLDGITSDEADHRYRHMQSPIDKRTNTASKALVPNISLGIRLGFRYKSKKSTI